MREMSKLEMLLRPVRRRMVLMRVVRSSAIGMLAGSGAALLWLAACRMFPLPYDHGVALCLVGAGLVAGSAYGLWARRVTELDAARKMDRQATSDAVTTALEHLASDHPAAKLQREDAEQAAARYVERLKEHAPWPGRQAAVRFVAALALVWIGAAVFVFVPNPMEDRIAAQAAVDREIEALRDSAEELAEKADQLDEESAGSRKLGETLDALRDRLADLQDPAEALREMEAVKQELERLAVDTRKQADELDELAENMQTSPQLRALGQALERKDASGMKQAMEGMRQEAARLNPEDRRALAEKLRELAEKMVGNETGTEQPNTLKQALEDAAEAMENVGDSGMDGENGKAALDALEKALAEGLTAEQLEALARQMADRLGQQAAALNERVGNSASGSQAGWSPLGAQGGSSGPNGQSDGLAGSGQSGSSDGSSGEGGSGQGSGNGGQGAGQVGQSGGQGGQNGAQSGGAGSGQGSGAGSGQGSSQNGAAGNGQGSGQGSGSGQGGAGSGSGSGSGQGSGAGSGSGSGSGQGSGSGSGSSSGSGSGQGGTGSGSGTGGLAGGFGNGSRGLVTTPRAFEGSGNVQQDGGPAQGGQVSDAGSSPALDGGVQSYEQVYSSYAAEARQSLNRSPLPPSMQQRVRDYFIEIQPNR